MDYDQLVYDLQYAPGIKLLKADHSPLILHFLHHQFKQEQHQTVPLMELADRLANTLEIRNELAPGEFPRPAHAYLSEWADENHRFIRITTPASSDTPLVELTADTERTIGWLEELHTRPFVGTESRFLYIIQLLRDIIQKSTEDPAARLKQLEQQRDSLQQQITLIQETGIVEDLYTTTQLKERFFEACNGARQLMRDFRLVEERFASIARELQEARLQSSVQKGTLIAYVLDADAELKSSDQGRSFYTFWDFLMSPSRQDELYTLLAEVQQQPDLQPVIHEGRVLQHLPANLLEAGEKVVLSNAGLAQQLRRMLDEQSIAERRRVRALLAEIKQQTFALTTRPPEEADFIELEGPPEVRLPMEQSLWEPGETFSLTAKPTQAIQEEPAMAELFSLHTRFYIDKTILARQVEALLDLRPRVTLAEVLAHYPPEKGLAEVIAYCALASDSPQHQIDLHTTETIELTLATPSGRAKKIMTIPRVLFQRRAYAE